MGTAAGWWCPAQLVDVRPLTLRKIRSRQRTPPGGRGFGGGHQRAALRPLGPQGSKEQTHTAGGKVDVGEVEVMVLLKAIVFKRGNIAVI